MLVQEFLERTVERLPNKVALVDGDRRLTYGEIEERANRLANALVDAGIRRGERVLLYLPNSTELVLLVFAVLKAGAVFVVVNPTTKARKLAAIARDCQASAIATSPNRAALVQQLRAEAPDLQTVLFSRAPLPQEAPGAWLDVSTILEQGSSQRPAHQNTEDDLACLIYTSGSTGDPKGVMCDHSNIDFASGAILQYLETTPDDVILCALPLSFDYGLYQVLMSVKVGARLVLEQGFLYPAHILQRIERERVTVFPGVPTIFAIVLQMDLQRFDLSSLGSITNTAAALPASHIFALRARFPQARLFSMYGLTETKRTLYLPPEELERRPTSVGKAIPGTEVWLEDEDGSRLPHGSTGELIARGRHVMRGYWNDPLLTGQRFREADDPAQRACKTGDVFRSDQEGFYYFIARKDEIIKTRGEKVAPLEVERVLYALDGVAEAAVAGVPDPILGEAVKAWIVRADPALDQATVLRHCREYLEDFMMPRWIEFCDTLPRTASGKISKKALR